jgi:superfamily I DNA and RNA helicase
MIEIIIGSNTKPASTQRLIDFFSEKEEMDGILYIGYPIMGTPIGAISLDAMLLSKRHGVIIFDIEESSRLDQRTEVRDEIFNNITAKLIQHKELVEKRKLVIPINVVTYAPVATNYGDTAEEVVDKNGNLSTYIDSNKCDLGDEKYRSLVSVIQIITSIRKTSKRTEIKKPDSRGAKLRKLEDSIANLDETQSKAVIETVEGLQRIRGLAGSGKTIILALKVAYLHAAHPDWNIAVTFNTRSLKDQFVDLITKFSIEHKNEEPDWKKIKILHAWGNSNVPGIYSEVCNKFGLKYLDYRTARNSFDIDFKDAFGGACNRALADLEKVPNFVEIYDAILIDEAQDLSGSFLKLCFKILKAPKRLIWAYDELQKLNETTIQNPEELFGITLTNDQGKPNQDIILERCYRNSRPILATAQAFGFGIYREKGLVTMFERPELWNDVGYVVEEGELKLGSKVILKRTNKTSPLFLENHSEPDDLIVLKKFENDHDQMEWIAAEIEKNLRDDELEYKDIIVINCNPLTTQKAVGPLRELLLKRGINNHIAGITYSPDKFFEGDSITFTGIYRAKGNEASMVYIINSQDSFSGLDLIKKRNILFTAITRSKAWVRICGYGEDMNGIEGEFELVKSKDFKLEFIYPTKEKMQKLNIIHRERTQGEAYAIKRGEKSLVALMKDMEEGKIKKEDLDPELLESFKDYFKKFIDDKNE